jgi:hypothetical protein
MWEKEPNKRTVKLIDLKPGIPDDFSDTHSVGPLVVMRHPDGSVVVEDGNHEYHKRLRENPQGTVEVVEIPFVPYDERDDEGRYLHGHRKRRVS